MRPDLHLGAVRLNGRRWRFRVWAPHAAGMEVRLTEPVEAVFAMNRRDGGYFSTEIDDVPPDSRYVYRLYASDGGVRELPDPASRSQPDGVHAPSQIVAAEFDWDDGRWCGLPLSRYVMYELHVGTFSPEGTFAGVSRNLDRLVRSGVTAVELMPVAQFPGSRNWGYDGVYPFAVQNSYGGPRELKRLVDACHRRGLAVVLDVVYNHLGPEGNYLAPFGPYFTDFYRTPWGPAINFDGPFSDDVRRFFVQNALQWVDEFRIDALRLDAVHAICDASARPFLEELARAVHRRADALDRRIHLIAESALNDTRIIRSRELGGFALDAQWNDDFHHSLHTALTEERSGYYRDYAGIEDLSRAWRDGYVYTGQYSAFRQRSHGNASRMIPARQFVVFAQNHDQVGNRLKGDRLSVLVSLEKQKLAAALVLLSPFIPLIFMGEEYGETAPFLYFVSHSDPDLIDAVRSGRRQEFAAFGWPEDPPDPQDPATFERSRLDPSLASGDRHQALLDWHRELTRLRAACPALSNLSKRTMTVHCDPSQHLMLVKRSHDTATALSLYTFGDAAGPVRIHPPAGAWRKRIDSAEARWMGPGSTVADRMQADGPIEVPAAAHSVVLWTADAAPEGRTPQEEEPP